METYSRQEIAG